MAAGQEIFMDVDGVRGMAKNFGMISDVLANVSKALEVLMRTLQTTAFMGAVGGFAIANYIQQIKPHIDEIAEKCEEFNKDLDASATAYENGDELGSTRFH